MTRRGLVEFKLAMGLFVLATPLLGGVLGSQATAQRRQFTYDLGEERLRGQIEKPEAFYILSATSLTYTSAPPEASFLDKLYQTVNEEPF